MPLEAKDKALLAVVHKLNQLPARWRAHASGAGSALYRAGFEHCATEIESVLEDLTAAMDSAPSMKCLLCRKRTYHPKDIEHRYCAQCHMYHDLADDGVTFELSA